ncbi:hypothetical protein CR513_50238, partial [Mucuna pruriens]
MEMSEHFDKITFHYVPRDDNQMADALATLPSMLQVNQGQEMTIHVRHQIKMAHCQHLDQDETEPSSQPTAGGLGREHLNQAETQPMQANDPIRS